MKKFWFVLALVIGGVFAEPVPVGTKGEVQKAKGLIDDLVASGADAEKLVSMAAETEKGSERFWLYSNAFILQTKEGKYAEATETLKTLQRNVTDIPEVNIINLIERNVGKKIAEVPELAAILKESKARLAAQRLVSKLKKDIRKNPKDAALKASLGEALAVCGDWKAALEVFAESQGKVSGIAKAELEAKRTMKIAAFWWDYKPCRELSSSKAFKAHAVGIYTELLKSNQFSVVEKTLSESRVAQFSEVSTSEEKSVETENNVVMRNDAKTDLGALEEICDTNGLIHCWRFNGTTKDEVGGSDALCHGNAQVDKRQVSLFGGQGMGGSNIRLGKNLVPNDESSVTIELWATQNRVEFWSRILSFGKVHGRCFFITWSAKMNPSEHQVSASDGCRFTGPGVAPFELGKEYHIGIVFEPSEVTDSKTSNPQWNIRVYKQDAKTGKTIKKVTLACGKDFTMRGFPNEFLHLGLSYNGNDSAASASYNEVRVWRRALDEKELTQNAIKFHKAGETVKGN